MTYNPIFVPEGEPASILSVRTADDLSITILPGIGPDRTLNPLPGSIAYRPYSAETEEDGERENQPFPAGRSGEEVIFIIIY